MKKFFYFFTLSAIVLGMASCGDGNDPEVYNVPEGAISGVFTVGEGKKVFFAKGNLWASHARTWTWRFAQNQWNYVGDAAANNCITNPGIVASAGTVDLFSWCSSSTYHGISNITNPNFLSGALEDWGTTIGEGWYTLSSDEWVYLFVKRKDAAKLFSMGTIDDVHGVILLPDNWAGEKFNDFTYNGEYYEKKGESSAYSLHTYSTTQWLEQMEAHGAVFLPAAGRRSDSEVKETNQSAYYWSCTPGNEDGVYGLYFDFVVLNPKDNCSRGGGRAVRLVHNVK